MQVVIANIGGAPVLRQIKHYYPFGLEMPGLGMESGGDVVNKYQYNGKELEDDEFAGGKTLMWLHYGARYYDPQLGRWHSVDPADEFHSPYVYVGNKPLIAIDPDGEETWLVHGTFADNSTWKSNSAGIWGNVFGESFDQVQKFSWNGANSSWSREQNANNMAENIMEHYKEYGGAINIVAHSHGGNVAIMAANILKENGFKIDNLVIIGTPGREYLIETGAVDNFISVFNYGDNVQKIGGNDLYVPFHMSNEIGEWKIGEIGLSGNYHPGAENVDVSNIANGHSDMHNNPQVAKKVQDYVEK